MSIIRGPRPQVNYTVFSNDLLNDKLPADALGVLVHLLSKPENWKVNITYLKTHFGCGKDKIYRVLSDLQEAGYATIVREHDSDGKFLQNGYVIHEKGAGLSGSVQPRPENPEVVGEVAAQPCPAQPCPDNPPLQKKDSTKDGKTKRPAKAQDAPYDEDFEALWRQYPRTRNTSKKDAWNFYRVMSDDKQEMVRRAVPLFAAAMRAEGRTEDKIMHMIRFLRGGVFETVAAPATTSSGATAKPDWHKTATREQWQKILTIWSSTNDWRASWGPAPGKPGCGVPEDMIAAHNLKHRGHMFSPEEMAGFREIASKHTVDNGRAA